MSASILMEIFAYNSCGVYVRCSKNFQNKLLLCKNNKENSYFIRAFVKTIIKSKN